MNRRQLLATVPSLAGVVFAGCLSDSTEPEGAETTPESTPAATETPDSSDTPDTTETPAHSPDWPSENCQSAPDIEELPEPPERRTDESVVDYVTEFERTYVVAAGDGYEAVENVQVNTAEETDDGYRVELSVEGVAETSTPEADGETPTPRPADATAHRVTYRLAGSRLLRTHRGFAGGQTIAEDCWTVGAE